MTALETGDDKTKLSPSELMDLAGKLVEESDPIKAESLKEQIISGFHGNEQRNA